jgi:hypothetical protein
LLICSSFQQTTIKDDTSRILSNSEELHHDISRLATNLEVKLTALEMVLNDRNNRNGSTNTSVRHLQTCVKTAATIVTSASTVQAEALDDPSVDTWDISSEFGWLTNDADFHSSLTLNWIASQTTESASPEVQSQASHVTETQQALAEPPVSLAVSPRSLQVDAVNATDGTEADRDVAPQPIVSMIEDSPDTSGEAVSYDRSADGRRKKKRRNLSLSKLLFLRSKEGSSNGGKNAHSSSLCMDQLKISDKGMIRLKLVFVGDGACGKTCFLMCVALSPNCAHRLRRLTTYQRNVQRHLSRGRSPPRSPKIIV